MAAKATFPISKFSENHAVYQKFLSSVWAGNLVAVRQTAKSNFDMLCVIHASLVAGNLSIAAEYIPKITISVADKTVFTQIAEMIKGNYVVLNLLRQK